MEPIDSVFIGYLPYGQASLAVIPNLSVGIVRSLEILDLKLSVRTLNVTCVRELFGPETPHNHLLDPVVVLGGGSPLELAWPPPCMSVACLKPHASCICSPDYKELRIMYNSTISRTHITRHISVSVAT